MKAFGFQVMSRIAIFLMALSVLAPNVAYGSNGALVLDYMLENRTSLFNATHELGLDFVEVAEELGYEDFIGAMYADKEISLLFADCWLAFTLIEGSAPDIGILDSTVTEYFDLRMANDASFLPKCDGGHPTQTVLSFQVRVWTVGNEYPVAFLNEITGSLSGPPIELLQDEVTDDAWLGYSNSELVEDSIRENIDSFVEDFAITLLRVRGLP